VNERGDLDGGLLLRFIPGQLDRLQSADAKVDSPSLPVCRNSGVHQAIDPLQYALPLIRQEIDLHGGLLNAGQSEAAGNGKPAWILQQIGLVQRVRTSQAAETGEPIDGNAEGRRLWRPRPRQRLPTLPGVGGLGPASKLFAQFRGPRVVGRQSPQPLADRQERVIDYGRIAKVRGQPGQFGRLLAEFFRVRGADVACNLLQQAQRLVILMFRQPLFRCGNDLLLHLTGECLGISMVGF